MSLRAQETVSVAGGTAIRLEEDPELAAQEEIPALADIVREHQGMVFSLAYHFLRDRGLAEEAGQEVFLELHRHLGAIESRAHLVFWLRKVASRRCIDQIRRRSFWPKLRLDEVPEPAANAVETTPYPPLPLPPLLPPFPTT